MVGKSVLKYADESVVVHSLVNSTVPEYEVADGLKHYSPIQVVTALGFIVGSMQMLMYVLRMGAISSLLSETLVSGFTTAAGIHVLTSQIKDLVGIRLTPVTTNFKLILVRHRFSRFDSIED